MPKFNKTIDELDSHYDKWLYVLKNLHKLDRLPDKLKEKVFERVFEVAEIAKFSHEEYLSYEDSLKYYRDLKNSLDTAKEEGHEEGWKKGLEKGKEERTSELVKSLLENGVSIEIISKSTGLTVEQIEKMLQGR
ncbi:Rpn family recombination-promoting nuclease/putative transposase [Marinilabiliaceae bacterium D04]|uniref:Rpn family recombination-promoting nuclease/putative transposase n=2 Tax=Plebeiibacterium marinum TaxID=2992111 RepID=A0AAE3MAX1_9BACT|nr:Rpn family recombination-promoting nuclease/putative transposase [Plebeiobacterium marinum]